MRFSKLVLAVIVFATVNSCKQKQDTKPDEKETEAKAEVIKAADFNVDSAYYFVVKQVEFGPRVPNSKAHVNCAAWLEKTLKKYSPQVIVQPFTAKAWDGTTLNCKNIIASFNPKSSARILLCSHWDSRPFADQDPDSALHL